MLFIVIATKRNEQCRIGRAPRYSGVAIDSDSLLWEGKVMQKQSLGFRVLGFVVGAAFFVFSGAASADPPSRVARLGYTAGAVSFSPAGENDWVQATVNRPLTNGDRLWTDAGARAEVQAGGAVIRMNANTSVSVLNLDDQITQLQLTQGTLNVRVRRLAPNQVFEVDTPNLAFTLRQPGEYRIAVDPDGNATDIIVRKGQGEALGEGAAYLIDSRQPYRFRGTDLSEYEYLDAARLDEFDRWAADRDRAFDNSVSARYVSRDVVGYQDLDANGSWRVDATYGNVWIPNRVAADWAPYRDGHWAWIDPWGWTWVDDAPWGFAVSHYGRWTNLRGTWGWVPGPVRSTAYYAPALVVFVGGDNFRLTISSGNVGGVAWFPLAPREVFRPSYPVSRGYFENVNRSNTVINNTVINNTYNTTNVTKVVYVNRQVPGAVVAVPTTTFVQSQPVSRAAVRVNQETVARAAVAVSPSVAPTERSVRGAAVLADKPPARVFERPVVARSAPAAAHVGFAAQQQQLTLKPGKPLDDATRKTLKPAADAPRSVVKVLAPAQVAPPKALPPPSAPPQGAAQPQAARQPTTPVLVPQPAEPRGKADQRGNGQQRAQAIAPPPPPPLQRAVEPKPVAPQVVPSGPATQAQPQRPVPPKLAPAPQVVLPPAPLPGARPESARVIKQTEPSLPLAAPKPPPLPAQIQAEPKNGPGGRAQQRENDPQRAQPIVPASPAPVQRAPESKPVPPPVAPAVPMTQAPPQRPVPPKLAPPAQVVPPEPAIQHPAKAVPAPVARQPEPRPPVAAPRPPPPQSHPAPQAEPRGQMPTPAASRPHDRGNGRDGPKREEDKRGPQG